MKARLNAIKSAFKKTPIRVYLLYLFIASLIFTGVTFSGYVSSTSGGDGAQVAVFANDVTINLPITAECYPGCEFEVDVTVSNYEGMNVCQVSQEYTLTATFLVGNLPLKVTWKYGNDSGQFYAYDAAKSYTHTAIVSWDESNSSYEYSDEIEVLRISVYSEQIN